MRSFVFAGVIIVDPAGPQNTPSQTATDGAQTWEWYFSTVGRLVLGKGDRIRRVRESMPPDLC